MNWKCCFNVIERWAASKMVEVENRLKLSKSYCCYIGKQVNFELEINMNDKNYLISSQHLLPFGINTMC